MLMDGELGLVFVGVDSGVVEEAEVEAKLIGLLAVRKFFMYEHPESMLVEALVWEQAWQQQQ